jgi:hypothetical protein
MLSDALADTADTLAMNALELQTFNLQNSKFDPDVSVAQ